MKEIAVVESSKNFLKNIAYNIRFGRKFKKFNIDKSLSEMLISRNKDKEELKIFEIISESKTKEDFDENVKNLLKSEKSNVYASALLIGNLTGKYAFSEFFYNSINNLNIDAFSGENEDLLSELKAHFPEYVMENNKRKNSFAQQIEIGNKSSVRDLSQSPTEEEMLKDFDRILNGVEIPNDYYKPKIVLDYVMNTIGTYSREDIKDNFQFVLYDMDSTDRRSLDERRKEYLDFNNLSNNQRKKIKELNVLQGRLQNIKGEKAKQLLSRINEIGSDLCGNIDELEDIYSDYEVLYREDLVDNLYVPEDDITIIEDYRDLRPQMLHKFIRSPQKFESMEVEKNKQKILSERGKANTTDELTEYEQKRLDEMQNQVEENLNQYKVNYTTDGKGTVYTDASGLDEYHADTSNQISASVFEGKELITPSNLGIVGIGFNRETLTPEAIAISSESYKTTNKGLNNLEYNEENEFKQMSASFSELLKAKGNSEIVMHRRGLDFDTKASYIFAKIDSSNPEQTQKIMEEIEQVRAKEGLKVVVYDINKIRESLEKSKQQEYEKD